MNKQTLKEIFKRNDINTIGICGVNIDEKLKAKLLSRIEKGYITGMEEESLQNRIDAKLIMEDAKSIIVALFPYYKEDESTESNLSRYCRGLDYHIVAKNLLQTTCEEIKDNIEHFEYKIFVDNGPLVDRHLAYSAGLGYYGINNNLINDEYGSYFFIGYIINNYEFDIDKPIEKSCIKCNNCVKYCPGNALLGNYDMNPKKCLSYITQKKGELTEIESNLIKDNQKVFGCDICQEVCPHNNGLKQTHIKEFTENTIDKLEKEEIDNISNKEFKRRYGNRAFSWRGKNIIKRNLEIVESKE